MYCCFLKEECCCLLYSYYLIFVISTQVIFVFLVVEDLRDPCSLFGNLCGFAYSCQLDDDDKITCLYACHEDACNELEDSVCLVTEGGNPDCRYVKKVFNSEHADNRGDPDSRRAKGEIQTVGTLKRYSMVNIR